MTQSLKNKLNERFKNFKVSIEGNNYTFGKFWQKEKNTFDVSFEDGFFKSRGSRDYLPVIFNEGFSNEEIIPIDGKKFVNLGAEKLCTLKNKGSTHLSHTYHYFNEIKKYIKNNDICLDVGSGSGLLQFFIHHEKGGTNILIDIPESIQSSIALCFTLFPNSKIILPNEIEKNDLNLKDFDFIFLLPNQKNLIKKFSVNFCLNTNSFMEMDIDEVNNYIKYFNDVLKSDGYCFISNRILKRTYFFHYNFKNLNFEKVYIKKDNFYFSKENYKKSSFMNLLLQKKKYGKFSFNIFDFVFGIFNLKIWELLFWFKFYLKKITLYPFVQIKSKIFQFRKKI